MKLATGFLIVPAILTASLVAFASQAQAVNAPDPMQDHAIQTHAAAMAKIAAMPLKLTCYQPVATRTWVGLHGLAFGADLKSKTVELVGWTKLTDWSQHVLGNLPTSFALNAHHSFPVVENLQMLNQQGVVTIAYVKKWTTHPMPCRRCTEDPQPSVHANAFFFQAHTQPGSKDLELQKLVIDGKEMPLFQWKCQIAG